MNPKRYLMQLRLLDAKILNLQKELDDLRLVAQSTGGLNYDEKVQTSHQSDAVEKRVIKCVDLENKINCEIDRFIDLKHKIIQEINSMDDVTHMKILYMRYVEYKRLEEISVELNYSYGRMKHMHGEALNKFQKIMENNKVST